MHTYLAVQVVVCYVGGDTRLPARLPPCRLPAAPAPDPRRSSPRCAVLGRLPHPATTTQSSLHCITMYSHVRL